MKKSAAPSPKSQAGAGKNAPKPGVAKAAKPATFTLRWDKRRRFGDMTALWRVDPAGPVEFALVPAGMERDIPPHRADTDLATSCRGLHDALGVSFRTHEPSNCAQLHVRGDAFDQNFSLGRTMRDSASVAALRFEGFEDVRDGGAGAGVRLR